MVGDIVGGFKEVVLKTIRFPCGYAEWQESHGLVRSSGYLGDQLPASDETRTVQVSYIDWKTSNSLMYQNESLAEDLSLHCRYRTHAIA